MTATLSETRNELALVEGFSGVVDAVRGRQAEADRYFARGLARAEADEAPWYSVMVRTLRADYTARWAPHRSLVDARRAQREAARARRHLVARPGPVRRGRGPRRAR